MGTFEAVKIQEQFMRATSRLQKAAGAKQAHSAEVVDLQQVRQAQQHPARPEDTLPPPGQPGQPWIKSWPLQPGAGLKSPENPVFSATNPHRRGSRARQQYDFLYRATQQIAQAEQALQAGEYGDAVICAYQAGLRTAGALLLTTSNARRRKPNAWESLQKLGEQEAVWAKRFLAYRQVKDRATIGVPGVAIKDHAEKLIKLAQAFLAETEQQFGLLPSVA